MAGLVWRRHESKTQGPPPKKRPTADALSRLAKLMALVDHKQEQRARKIEKPSPSAAKDCGWECSDVTGRVSRHQKEHRMHKLHSRQCCGQDQLAGGCQPSRINLKALVPPGHPHSPGDAPTRDKSRTCNLCLKTLRSAAGLACHKRLIHQSGSVWKRRKTTEIDQKPKSPRFPCRSCDKVFTQTSTLYLHRKAEHRRDRSKMKSQRSSIKSTRQRKKGETYPCSHCGRVFLHHLTRWAHFKSYSTHYQTHLRNTGKSKDQKAGKAAEGSKLTGLPKSTKDSKTITKRIKKQEMGHDKEPERQDKDGNEREFPCPSCAEVLNSPAALHEHEKVHQPPCAPDHCSVCTGGIVVPTTTEDFLNQVYHCVPCGEAFVDLLRFLRHCQAHSPQTDDNESDKDELSDD